MERELVELFEAAKKAADSAAVSSGPTVDRCLDVLNQLKNYPVTYDVLVSTQVAKRLRHLAKHPAGQIQKRVSDVLEIWKKIIISEATTKKNDGIDVTSSKKTEVTEANVKLEKVHTTGSIKVEKVSKTGTVKTGKIEEGDLIKPGSVSRSETIKVEKKVGNYGYLAVESVMFDKMGRSNGAQKVKYRSIMFNLKDSKNPDLRRKVLLGQVKPEWLINMTPDEMASDERQRENEHIKKKALFDCERGGPPKATTNQFRCGRCGQRKCTYYQLQTRSADEPMTTFVTCVNCNNRWKFC
ncbi:transcript elongation factor IIS [Actinidia rufa]|uniref:Transcription elongation factor n=1 Tax=Actinidia rufa TaxID=165716 RepID=A0A7J0FBC8_9ERIC|nr:transcript elongation factor IIS [Actinidia rufa]